MSPLKAVALFLLGVVLLFPHPVIAQENLSLEEAIRIGLQNNYDIRIATKQEAISRNNVTLGNAGFLPTVDARATRIFREDNSEQTLQNGDQVVRDGASSNNLNSSVNLNWTIFDGLAMFINYDRLQALKRSGELFTRQVVENTVADITYAYYEVVRQENKIQAIQDAIEISEVRVEITEAQYEVGVSAKVEILRAQVDLNADRAELLRQQELLQNSKIDLNQLLARTPDANFVTSSPIVVDTTLDFGVATNNLALSNPLLRRLQLNREIANLNLKSIRASRFPVIGITSAYSFSRSESEPLNPYSTQSNLNQGYNYGLTVSLPIFNGFNINRLTQNARIDIETSELEYLQEENRLSADLARAYSQYTNRLQLLQLEESNQVLAQENAAIALERYRLGLLTAIELREAQRNELVAENRLIDIRYEAKAAETELRRISSTLL